MKESILKRLSILGRLIRNTATAAEWNAICEEVKAEARALPQNERSGEYPAWWFREVILSGLASEMARKWGSAR